MSVLNTEAEWSGLPRATVVVVNYNGREHLEDCFRSLQQLRYPPDRLELILVDNASSDGSVEWMRQHFPQVLVVENSENFGFGKGNNIGAQQASGEMVAFLNTDMRVAQRWLLELISPLMADPEIVCVGSRILTWDGRKVDFGGSAVNFYGFGYQLGWGEPELSRDPEKQHSAVPQPIISACGGAMVVRRREFLEAGGFDEDFFSFYEDADLGWRFWVLGYRVVLAHRSIVYHKHHGSWSKVSNEKVRVLYERNSFFTMLKNYDDANLQRVLPAALLLLFERAYLSAGIDTTPFRVGPKPPRQEQAPAANSDETATIVQRTGRQWLIHYLKATLDKLWRGEMADIYVGGRAALREHGEALLQRLQRWWLAWMPGRQGTRPVPLQTLSYLVAADDIIALYPRMLEKRRFVQNHRRRPDAEILELFVLPHQVGFFTGEYVLIQRHVERLFEIDRMFEQALSRAPSAESEAKLPEIKNNDA